VSVRFSAAELEKIDAARGTMKRSDFVRAAVGEKLARKASS
jgi:metal-responsive CopG/Arc/MetJ family transcriptional regulator